MSESARRALVDAGERLFAARGVNAVSLREVGVAAGHRNNSAAQYHFGDRDGLLDAIFRARMSPIDARRNEMLDELVGAGRQGDLRSLVEALVLPLADGLGDSGGPSWYARFLSQMLADPSFRLLDPPRDEVTGGLRRIVDLLDAALVTFPKGVRRVRVELASSLVVHALADQERREERAGESSIAARRVLAAHLVDAVVGLLEAPSSSPVRVPSVGATTRG